MPCFEVFHINPDMFYSKTLNKINKKFNTHVIVSFTMCTLSTRVLGFYTVRCYKISMQFHHKKKEKNRKRAIFALQILLTNLSFRKP